MFLTTCTSHTFQQNFQINAESTSQRSVPILFLLLIVLNNKLWPPAIFLRMFMMRTHSSKSAGQWNKINQKISQI